MPRCLCFSCCNRWAWLVGVENAFSYLYNTLGLWPTAWVRNCSSKLLRAMPRKYPLRCIYLVFRRRMKWEQWQLGHWLLGMGLSDLVYIILSDPLNNPPRWLSSSPFEEEENWVLWKLSNLSKVARLSGREGIPVSPALTCHGGWGVASLHWLSSPSCLECSLLPIPSHQNLLHLAGP